MIIHIEGFNHKTEYFEKNINVNNKPIYMLTDWIEYEWYQDGNKLDHLFAEWKTDVIYTLYYNANSYIRLKIMQNNGNHQFVLSPLLSTDMKIKDLKDILSIQNNIYFHNIKLNENKTLKYYNINNMDAILFCNTVVIEC